MVMGDEKMRLVQLTSSNLEEIAIFMDDHNDFVEEGNVMYLDVKNSSIVYISSELIRLEEELIDDKSAAEELELFEDYDNYKKILADKEHQFLEIEKSDPWASADDRKAFIDFIENENVKEKLRQAFSGKGAYRRFRAVLDKNDRYLEEWYEFQKNRQEARVKKWLEECNIVVQ